MASDAGWFGRWFPDSYFPPVWFAEADDSHLTEEERSQHGGGADAPGVTFKGRAISVEQYEENPTLPRVKMPDAAGRYRQDAPSVIEAAPVVESVEQERPQLQDIDAALGDVMPKPAAVAVEPQQQDMKDETPQESQADLLAHKRRQRAALLVALLEAV